MKKRHFFLILFLGISTLYAQSDNRLEGIEQELEALMEWTKAPGMAVAVVKKDQVVYARGFGYRDYENQLPVDENTLFAIGSSTKAFTASLLGILREEKALSFDDKPALYLPGLQFHNEEMNSQITIKDLMCHRTGLPRHDLSWYFFPSDNRDSLIDRIRHMEPFTGVRQQWYYNNFMYLVQGAIAEELTGKSWEDNIRERFFEPLAMSRSNLSIQELEKAQNAAFGYEVKNDSLFRKMDYYSLAGMGPAGSINSSVSDLSNWLIAWINHGKYNGQQIIPATYIDEAITAQMVIGGGLPDPEFPDMHFAAYGYGWGLTSYSGHYLVSHGGNIDGFSADVAIYPSDSLGIVVLTNQNGSALPSLARNTLANKMLGIEGHDWLARYKKQMELISQSQENAGQQKDAGIVANTKPSHILMDYTGIYENPAYGTFRISLQNDSLFVHLKKMTLWLRHVHYNVFEQVYVTESGKPDTTAVGPQRMNFISNLSGDISHASIQLEPMLEPIRFKRTPVTIDLSTEQLAKYTGTYDLFGTAIRIYTKESDKLYLFVQGQPEYELLPTGHHSFSFKVLEGFKVEFKPSEDGSIKEALLIQPHGNFTIVKNE